MSSSEPWVMLWKCFIPHDSHCWPLKHGVKEMHKKYNTLSRYCCKTWKAFCGTVLYPASAPPAEFSSHLPGSSTSSSPNTSTCSRHGLIRDWPQNSLPLMQLNLCLETKLELQLADASDKILPSRFATPSSANCSITWARACWVTTDKIPSSLSLLEKNSLKILSRF